MKKINLNKIVDSIRLKISQYKEIDKNDGRNRRVIILADTITIFLSLILSSIVANNFTVDMLLIRPDLNIIFLVLGV